MARLIGLFAMSLLLVLGAALIVGHYHDRAVFGQLADINRDLNRPVEHRSVSTSGGQSRNLRSDH